MIEARGLTLDYPRRPAGGKTAGPAFDRALDGLDLSVPRGASLAVVGPSGCGKSTLLYAIAGLAPATGGRVAVDGMPPGARAGTALVFQDYGLFPWKTARENVELGLRPGMGKGLTWSARRERALSLLRRFGVDQAWPTSTRPSCPVARGSAQLSPVPWPRSRTSCCWTSLPARWMPCPRSPSSVRSSACAATPTPHAALRSFL